MPLYRSIHLRIPLSHALDVSSSYFLLGQFRLNAAVMGTRIEEVKGGSLPNDLLLRDFTSSHRRGYVRVFPESEDDIPKNRKGYVLPKHYCDFERRIREFEVRDDDIVVASYPKTGTTWTQEMVWCIGNNLDFEKAMATVLPVRFPFLELTTLFEFRSAENEAEEDSLKAFLKDSVKFTAEMESPRYIKTHLPWELLPDQMKSKQTKIIYVARNPKDTCVSYYHHSRLIEGYRGNLEDFVELFLQDTVSYSSYWEHLLSYWEHREDPNVLFIKYEDMKKDLPPVVKKVVQFMGKKELNEEELSKLCSHLSFESMKNNLSVNYEYVIDQDKAASLPEESRHFMRKGKVNGWKEEISEGLARRFDEWTESHLSGTDFRFD
ncbi:hypothetical protein J437_LFUL010829 [Ladona fulva]|uniref:Sulfotransferase domain-containing protein n=1 Tax=Ladona fulva TaxID=123851 RepID=A0A8K0KAE8_LADFU|nr:hypothetical protein J437_LFUL010829 [Ladona fulva]